MIYYRPVYFPRKEKSCYKFVALKSLASLAVLELANLGFICKHATTKPPWATWRVWSCLPGIFCCAVWQKLAKCSVLYYLNHQVITLKHQSVSTRSHGAIYQTSVNLRFIKLIIPMYWIWREVGIWIGGDHVLTLLPTKVLPVAVVPAFACSNFTCAQKRLAEQYLQGVTQCLRCQPSMLNWSMPTLLLSFRSKCWYDPR
jgi:hypothetical protein